MSIEVAVRHRLGSFDLDAGFEAPAGIIAIFGRSGSGKTSLVNAVAGLLRPTEGIVRVSGALLLDTRARVFVSPHRRRVGYVFQEGRLFPHLTVRQNLNYGRWFAPVRPTAEAFDHIVELLGLDGLLDRRPGRLSGGEKQRVAIGRALLSEPRVLLMDEPLASLDDARKEEILPYLERLRDESRVPVLYVSHAVSEVARLADWVVVLEDGCVIRAGSAAEVLSDPQIMPSFGVREAGAVIPARVVAHDAIDGLTELHVSAGRMYVPLIDAPCDATVRLRIEASDIVLSRGRPDRLSALNVLPATVTAIREGAGPGAAVGLLAGEDRLLARITRRSVRDLELRAGAHCYVIVKATQVARTDIGR